MSIVRQVREEIDTFEPGTILTYASFSIPQDKFVNLAKSLSTLCKEGVIKRMTKGMYYKPSFSRFGEQMPTDEAIINTCIESNRKTIAYVSGTNIYRQMGFTTQLSREYVVMNDTRQGVRTIQNLIIRFVKSPVREVVKEIKYLQLLDAISDIKNIPACTPNDLSRNILVKIKMMPLRERKQLVRLAFYYKPRTRALLGAFMEHLGEKALSATLRETLNPLTSFHIGISEKTLPNKALWQIA